MGSRKRSAVAWTCIGFLALAAVPATAQDVSEDFEGFIPNTTPGDDITLGTTPKSATLGGDAFAGVVGIGALYHSGIRAWMIEAGGTGTITFETNAAEVSFWAIQDSGAGGGLVITAFDDDDNEIDSSTHASGDPFALVKFTGSVDRITFENQSSSRMSSVDDLSFTAVPEPAMLGLLAMGLLGWRRRRSP